MANLSTMQAEAIEAEYMFRYLADAPVADQKTLGIATRRLSGGVVLSARNDPTQYWSKTLGLGFTEPITGELVKQILDFYRAEQNPLGVLQFAPEVLPQDWDEIVRVNGLTPGARIAKYAAPIENVAAAGETSLRIAPVAKDDAEQWAKVVLDGFGMPHDGLVGMLIASSEHPSTHAYAAWHGDTIVGGASLHVHGDIASLNTASILQPFWKRGAQTALISARLGKARELGCRWITTETFQPAEGEHNSSMSNMLRAGLVKLYIRQNYIWRG